MENLIKFANSSVHPQAFDLALVEISKGSISLFEKEVIALGGPSFCLSAFLMAKTDPRVKCSIVKFELSDLAVAFYFGRAIGYSYRTNSLGSWYHGGVFVNAQFRFKGVGAVLAKSVGFNPRRNGMCFSLATEDESKTLAVANAE